MYNPIHPPMHDRPLSANGGTRWRRVEFGIHLLGANFPCLASSSFAIVSHHGHNRNVAKRFARCANRRQSDLRNKIFSRSSGSSSNTVFTRSKTREHKGPRCRLEIIAASLKDDSIDYAAKTTGLDVAVVMQCRNPSVFRNEL